MKQPWQQGSGTVRALAVAVPGLLGLSVIGRTAAIYVGTDPLALCLVLAMGLGFGLGYAELFARLRRAAMIDRETRGLPEVATDETIDAASHDLRLFLRARIEQSGNPPGRESFTSYLVGLMVMLGLLGTLLGLFATLRGAGQALTQSTDVDALRSGLLGPMRGLTRSFGCSAAGVMASAMLGLSAVFVRRAEALAWAAVHAYANGPLRGLSPLRRQLAALGTLSVQGQALPLAARSLEHTASTLEALAGRWETAHATSLESQRKGAIEGMDRLGRDLSKSAVDAARSLHDTLAPLVGQSVAQLGETVASQMGAVLGALERDIHGRRAADHDLREAVRDELNAMTRQVEQGSRARAAEAQQRLERAEVAMRDLASDQAQLLALQREQASAHVSAMATALQEVHAQLTDDAAARRTEASRTLADLARWMDDTARNQADQGRTEREALAQLGQQLIQQAQAREDALAARWEALATSQNNQSRQEREAVGQLGERLILDAQTREAALAARWERLLHLAETSELARCEHAQHVADRLGGTAERIEQVLTERTQAQAEQAELAKGAFESLAGTTCSLDQVVSSLGAQQTRQARSLADELNAHVRELGQSLEGTTALVREAATVLKANSVEMAAVAEMFAASVDRQREAARTWMESLGEIEGAVERAGRGAAADALGDQLASTHEVFARQLQFQRELFEQLRTLRTSPAVLVEPRQGEQPDVSA